MTIDISYDRELEEQYLKEHEAKRCPVCHGMRVAIHSGPQWQNDMVATIRRRCLDCDSRWTDDIQVVSMSSIELGDDVPAEVMIALTEHMEEDT